MINKTEIKHLQNSKISNFVYENLCICLQSTDYFPFQFLRLKQLLQQFLLLC